MELTSSLMTCTGINSLVEKRPPAIEVSRAPGPTSERGREAVSGRVTDDDGLSHVMVFAGGDKVFFESTSTGQQLKAVPFTADVDLQNGENVVTVLATDQEGYSTTRSVVTWFDDRAVAQANPESSGPH